MPPPRIVAVLGSARADGDAARLCDAVCAGREAERFDLSALHIRDYAYGSSAAGDDFLDVARAIAGADGALLVTPVYWYAMSGVLKRFVDRLTDLVTVEKALGRRLAGRRLWVAACGSDPAPPAGFEVPFERTAAYFGMRYGGLHYAATHADVLAAGGETGGARAFGDAVFGTLQSATLR